MTLTEFQTLLDDYAYAVRVGARGVSEIRAKLEEAFEMMRLAAEDDRGVL